MIDAGTLSPRELSLRGLNPYAVTLLLESFLRGPVRHGLPGVSFVMTVGPPTSSGIGGPRDIRVTLELVPVAPPARVA
jgi:hypothetical protein